MKAVIRLINQHYWHSKTEPVFTFILPLFILGIFSHISFDGGVLTIATAAASVPGLIAMMITSNAMQTVPASIQSFKNSSLFKRIGSTPIKPWMFIVACSIFYSTVFAVEICWMLLLTVIFFCQKNMPEFPAIPGLKVQTDSNYAFIFIFNHVNWGGYVVSQLYTIILAIVMGLFIVSITKSVMGAQGIGMAVFFWSMFLSGQLIPLSSLLGNSTLDVFSYFTPFRFTNALQFESFISANTSDPNYLGSTNVFEYSSYGWSPESWQSFGLKRPMYYAGDFWANWFVPLACIFIFGFVAIKKLRWGNR